ncbi:response regulator transcription factor [Paenibacillus sabuli]
MHMARFVELELRHAAFEAGVALDGETGLHMAAAGEWDLILLDLMLPGLDGLTVCRRLRRLKRVPIIMLTARDSVSDRVRGLDEGADDYLPKPFAMEELLARMRVIFRRGEEWDDAERELVRGDLHMRLDSRSVRKGGRDIALTRREFELLAAFMRHGSRVWTREELLDAVWGVEAVVDTNVVDVYVRYLRNKLDTPGEPSLIRTLRGIGYVLRT